MSIVDIFKANGLLSKNLPGYEIRREQIEMVSEVCETIENQDHLVVEAGTGIGKSLAYLAPFIFWSRDIKIDSQFPKKRVVVSTFTKALQQQLFEKDIPFLQKILGVEFKFALCVGSENYLCLRRLSQTGQHGLFETKEHAAQAEKIFEWRMDTLTGMISDLGFQPDDDVWYRVCRQADICMGKHCVYKNECFFQAAKKKEQEADVLVANHHLFFANISSGEKVLPHYEAVVFDEAHQLEDVATNYLGLKFSNSGLKYLLDSVITTRGYRGILNKIESIGDDDKNAIEKIIREIQLASNVFFSSLQEKYPQDNGSVRIRERNVIQNNLTDNLLVLSSELKNLIKEPLEEEEKFELGAVSFRIKDMADSLEMILSQDMKDYVYWVEIEKNQRKQRFTLKASPIEVGNVMREKIFSITSPIVFTSATLSVDGSFEYFMQRIGLNESRQLIIGSPFNYREKALMYISSHSSHPTTEKEDYAIQTTSEIKNILQITKGRTFVLFTSLALMRQVFESLKECRDFEVLMQGETPRYKMLEKFRNSSDTDNNYVLLGANTFWQGVDVPGKALECVIITKLPFSVPDDPVTEAKMEYIAAQGRDPFLCYQIPQAAIMLKQGFGRLIRTKNDRGVVAILDPRIKTKFYGEIFLKSLPQCRITQDIEDIEAFFKDINELTG